MMIFHMLLSRTQCFYENLYKISIFQTRQNVTVRIVDKKLNKLPAYLWKFAWIVIYFLNFLLLIRICDFEIVWFFSSVFEKYDFFEIVQQVPIERVNSGWTLKIEFQWRNMLKLVHQLAEATSIHCIELKP
jgi:hypothetical protein